MTSPDVWAPFAPLPDHPWVRAALGCTRLWHPAGEAHAVRVTRLALSLFDHLADTDLHLLPDCHLRSQTRLLLACGGLLHDVGRAEDPRHHPKIGASIILTRFWPLPGPARFAVARLVRGHRRGWGRPPSAWLSDLLPAIRRPAATWWQFAFGCLCLADRCSGEARPPLDGMALRWHRSHLALTLFATAPRHPGPISPHQAKAQPLAAFFDRQVQVTLAQTPSPIDHVVPDILAPAA
jgi:hypothetical protein